MTFADACDRKGFYHHGTRKRRARDAISSSGFVSKAGAWLASIPSALVVTMDALPSFPLLQRLRDGFDMKEGEQRRRGAGKRAVPRSAIFWNGSPKDKGCL
jgi:hypothetical protein